MKTEHATLPRKNISNIDCYYLLKCLIDLIPIDLLLPRILHLLELDGGFNEEKTINNNHNSNYACKLL